MATTAELAKRQPVFRILAIVFAVVALIVIVASFLTGTSSSAAGDTTSAPSTATATPTPTPTPTASAAECAPEFVQVAIDHTSNPQVDPEFNAKVNAQIAAGGNDPLRTAVLDMTGHNAAQLAWYAHQMGIIQDANSWQQYMDGTCLSKEGQRLHDKLDGAYHATGVTFAIGEAPADGVNSGVSPDGTYGIDASQGITGDRKAIEITLADGSKTWIMFRCGNPVFQGRPNLPSVPTDNPKPVCQYNPNLTADSPDCVPPVQTCPPGQEGGMQNGILVCKDSPSNDPGVQGNAPTGSGPNADPGPGAPLSPVQPPSTPRTNPDPPAATPPAPSDPSPSDPSPDPVPTSDPAPAPSPEASAPPPSDPVTTCIVIPNVEDCK